MAGIEKICEYSGEYPPKMWATKRNHIQICSKYRKLFRGADAEFVIVEKQRQEVLDTRYEPTGKIVYQYMYELRVKNPELQGNVEGCYVNWTFDMKDTKKRIKRMLRCQYLKVRQEWKTADYHVIG